MKEETKQVMRISCRPEDGEAYEAYCRLDPGKVRIFLDGQEQKDCVLADDVLGEVIRYCRDGDGKWTTNTETVYGTVEIVSA